ncbi:MAG: insulinase family protein [Deltaproteobacteria bacterium]|nr:MAG: insulinase family protein [Deltaproteobacteria bacterium]
MLLTAVALVPLAATAAKKKAPAPKKASSAETPALEIPFEKYTLPNGLEVILHEDHRLPLVAVSVWYHVGAFHEPPGRSGFAHLFEHMMFQGSEHVGPDQHFKILEEIGGTGMNGTTNFNRTNYFETVPSNQLETALWLESDRMGFLLEAMTPEMLENQREVVKNERRQRTETAPYGLADEAAWKALFPKPHPYHGMVIGSMKDLDAATLKDVREFFKKWYAPSNATLVVAGDFDPAQAKKLIDKYFGTLPKRPKPTPPNVKKAKLDKEVVIHFDEPVAPLPKVEILWHSPAAFEEGDAAADVLASILAGGKSSRLERRLVHELEIAQSVSALQYSMGLQSAFIIEAVARPGVSTDRLLEEIDKVLNEIREKGVTEEEVRRAVNKYETQFVSGLQQLGGFGGRAEQLQRYNHFLGDPGYLAQDIARYHAVTPKDVQDFVREWLTDKRVVLHAIPKTQATPKDAQASAQVGTASAPSEAAKKEAK